MSADITQASTQQTLANLLRAITENQRQQALALTTLREMFDDSPMLRRANVYKVYTYDTSVTTSTPTLLFDSTVDFGGFPIHYVSVDSPGGGTSFLRLNGALNDRITVATGVRVDHFDLRRVYYEVTVAAVGTARIYAAGWVK